ncbi:DUF2895 family protein [Pseudoalteromonas sp. SR41-6]|uniref:DUF2895 family protein n=1 Tax=Pseudoalteromonas sp. SR41-6 TaxID=2760948 RepID=UPI00160084BB|nr:DUF2895 family protein [Pseudoalteromonas sp. SR41-6]MBB1334011.1 DUF2895 family protein [Pseudoalteromonas sp. SR41-6]
MSRKPINRLDASTQAVRVLSIVCICLMFLLVHAHLKVINVPKQYTFWTPPDLTKGGFANLNAPEEIHVLNFTLTIQSNLYSWDENGQKEFPDNIDDYRNYLGDSYYKLLKSRADNAGNSYRGRERKLSFDYTKNNHYNVENMGNGLWQVTTIMKVKDYVANNKIKDEYIKYSLIVGSVTLPLSDNPFGLAIIGEFADSARLN